MLVLPVRAQAPDPAPHQQHPDKQSTSSDKQTTKATQKATSADQQTASADGPKVGQADHQFMTKAAMGSMMEVQLAEVAQEKAASAEVKEYAAKLKQDHQKANEQLKKIAEQRGVSLPSDMGKHQAEVQRLSSLSGAEFDRAYLKAQVKDHKKDIKEFQRQADRGMDSDVKAFASAQLPVLEEHLRQAQQLASSTGTRARSK
jgi:putative membrane protein